MSLETQALDVMGDTVQSWRDARDGQIYVECKGRCEFLGVAWNGQLLKLKNSKLFAPHLRYEAIITPGGKQEVIGLQIKYYRAWLFSISAERVKTEIRAQLLEYQERCIDVLDRYWQEKRPLQSDFLIETLQKAHSKDYNALAIDQGGVELVIRRNAELCQQLSNYGLVPSKLKLLAKDLGVPKAIINAGGQAIMRFLEKESAAACAFHKHFVMRGAADAEVLPVSRKSKELFKMMVAAGLPIGELDLP